jgi:hypothetical protein
MFAAKDAAYATNSFRQAMYFVTLLGIASLLLNHISAQTQKCLMARTIAERRLLLFWQM